MMRRLKGRGVQQMETQQMKQRIIYVEMWLCTLKNRLSFPGRLTEHGEG